MTWQLLSIPETIGMLSLFSLIAKSFTAKFVYYESLFDLQK